MPRKGSDARAGSVAGGAERVGLFNDEEGKDGATKVGEEEEGSEAQALVVVRGGCCHHHLALGVQEWRDGSQREERLDCAVVGRKGYG